MKINHIQILKGKNRYIVHYDMNGVEVSTQEMTKEQIFKAFEITDEDWRSANDPDKTKRKFNFSM